MEEKDLEKFIENYLKQNLKVNVVTKKSSTDEGCDSTYVQIRLNGRTISESEFDGIVQCD